MIRAFVQRRKYKTQLSSVQMNSGIYFKREELMETIQNTKFDKNAKQQHVSHQYSTGAMYNGLMKGGFREGKGVMTWQDGAKYDGEWKEGYACGKGTFYHADGDIYEGSWLNNKCKGYGVYTNKKGARYEGHWKNDT